MAPFVAGTFGNTSGAHDVARRAKNAVEEARERAAGLLGCRPGEIVFTSGGTESDNLAIKGRAQLTGGGIVTTRVEHEAVLEAARFCERHGSKLTLLDVDRAGSVDVDQVAAAVDDDTAVVSVMWANNETGARQPLAAISAAIGGRAVLHSDAVQAFVSEPVPLDGIELLSLGAHKFGGPKGVGLLYVRNGVGLEPLLHGGGHELGRRSGTLNVAGIVGMVAAMEATVADRPRLRTIDPAAGLIQHSHLRFPGWRNETLLVRLDQAGVAASTGSACSAGAATVSHVLSAMGLPVAVARESLRFTFGWSTTVSEAEEAARLVRSVVSA
jgi:cysteine sulfinate desulfinase/cysteine desulfurase-like protein